MKNKLAIFDLDGTLFDTNDVNYYSYQAALETVGVKLSKEYFVTNCIGKHYKQFLPGLVNSEDMEIAHKLKKSLYASNIKYAKENKHLFNIIDLISSEYYIALVTTASRQNVKDILAHFECESKFDLILTQEDVTTMKPDPEGFLLAMDKFKISKENTIIFEDSESGLEAARRSGAMVYKVENFT